MLVVKNPPAQVGDIRDTGSTSVSGRSPGIRNGTSLHGQSRQVGFNPWGSKESDTIQHMVR